MANMQVKEFFLDLDNLSTHEKGEFFERFLKHYFLQSSEYSKLFRKVERWSEYEDKKGRMDTGVDLVAYDNEGNKWGIQVKYHQDNIGLRDISTFLTNLGTKEFQAGILVIKNNINTEVERKIENFEKKIRVITLDDILNDVKNIDIKTGNIEFKESKKEIRPYQKDAIKNVIEGFITADRGKLIMPPGSGKTFTSLKITEGMLQDGGLVLFLCPSISLLDQTLRNWLKDSDMAIEPIAVVSDKGVGREEDSLDKISVLSYPPTTNTQELLSVYEYIQQTKENKTLTVIFSTYQSVDVIEEAQKQGLGEFDLMICDEAHRTAGYFDDNQNISNFKKVHSDDYIKAKKRLYMTATPKVYKTEIEDEADYIIYNMNDEIIYGKTFYEYTFKRAVDEGYLTDYKVIVFGIDKNEVQDKVFSFLNDGKLRLEDTTKLYGLFKFLNNGYEDITGERRNPDLKKGILFVNTVNDSKKIANHYKDIKEDLEKSEDEDEIDKELAQLDIDIKHIEGKTSAIERKRLLNWLGDDVLQKRFLVNAKVLTEGIDVPTLDMIAFFKPKKSEVDIIQAVGRVMRKAKGKDYGYILVPVVIDTDKPEDQQIHKTDYATVVKILDALRSIDDTYKANIRIICKKISEEEADAGLTDKKELSDTQLQELEDSRLVLHLPFNIKKGLTTRVLKSLGLGKKYLETWAKDISEIAKTLTKQIQTSLSKDEVIKNKFTQFLNTIREFINEDIKEEQAISMLVQYILTRPIFEAMFEEHQDVISVALKNISNEFTQFFETETEKLKEFYERVKQRAKGIYSEGEKQDFLRQLYDNFFRVAFSTVSEQLGIAYTPVEIVDFIIRISDDIIKREFRKDGINSEDIVILEPFSGTGTFLARVVDYLDTESLKDKYQNKKLWANEILLLPYYISKVNTEIAYKKKTGEYKEFETMCLTDSFQMMEKIYGQGAYNSLSKLFPEKYSEILNTQKESKINLIISNPPYFARAESGNSQIVRGKYNNLREKIEKTFAKYTENQNKNSMYDSYILAIRMGIDRIEEGVVAYVVNNGWLESNAGQGVRKVLEDELDKIYVVNLKGNLRNKDKSEGDNVFNVRVGICIVFMVKKNKPKDKKAEIYYYDIGNGLKAKEKLYKLTGFKSLDDIPFVMIQPNAKSDWLNQRGIEFYSYPVIGDNSKNINKEVIFNLYSNGLSTSRDSYTWNLSKEKVREYMERLIENFNHHVEKYKRIELTEEDIENKTNIELNEAKIKWDDDLLKEVKKGKSYTFENGGEIYNGIYRPFITQYVYFSKVFNARTYQLPKIFPYPDAENLVIVVSNKANNFDVMMVDRLFDLHLLQGGSLGFPLYTYKVFEKGQGKLFSNHKERYNRLSNISYYALQEYRKRYGKDITEEDIFYYIFGMLNNPNYQSKFKNELMREIPRIPFVEDREDFCKIRDIGKKIADLQINYEKLPFYDGLEIEIKKDDWTVKEIKIDKEKGEIKYNDYIIIRNIPKEAFEYKINGKSPLEWVANRYRYTKNTDSNTINDPNDVLREKGNTYIIDLIKRWTYLSVEMVKLKQKLLKIEVVSQ